MEFPVKANGASSDNTLLQPVMKKLVAELGDKWTSS